MNIPNDVLYIINKFYENGFEAFIVGGSVRDNLLNKPPKDFDITTNALPHQIQNLFEKTVPTGIKHGTVTVLINDMPYEVTTYRIDGSYIDNRHPSDVIFVSDLKKDLSRRDFTINAMAYNPREKLVDIFSGEDDIKNKIIRTVGDSDLRFKEDALRMLRAIRFSSTLDFLIDQTTFLSIKNNKDLIKNVSSERIREEIIKILLSKNPSKGFKLLNSSGLLEIILPEIYREVGFDQKNPHHDKDIFDHTMHVLDNIAPNLILRLAALFHDVGKADCFKLDENGIGHFYGHNKKGEFLTKKIMRRLKFDNKTTDSTCTLVREHMNVLVNPKDSTIKKLINRVGRDLIFPLFSLQREDIKACVPPFLYLEHVDYMEKRSIEILDSNTPISTKDLAINGNDLIVNFDISPGKTIGNILNSLFEKVLEDPSLNTKATLLSIVKNELIQYKSE